MWAGLSGTPQRVCGQDGVALLRESGEPIRSGSKGITHLPPSASFLEVWSGYGDRLWAMILLQDSAGLKNRLT